MSLPSSVKGGNVNRIWHHTPRHTTIQHSTLRWNHESHELHGQWGGPEDSSSFFCRLSQQKHAFRSWEKSVIFRLVLFFFFFWGKVISDFNCSSRWRFWQSLAFVNKKCFYKKKWNKSNNCFKLPWEETKKKIQWFCGTASARVYKKSPYRRRIILIYIQLASLADVTALQIGRNFSLLYTKVLCCAVQYLEI